MLTRTLEPEVMDTSEEARDYDAMDHSTVNRVFAADFLRVWTGAVPVLDVGTGTAQIPVEVCRQSPHVVVHGIDLAEEMLKLGRENVKRAGFADRIRLSSCDAKAMSFDDGSFGAVMSNSIIHHIPKPRKVFAEMVRVVARDGVLFVRDLCRPSDETTLTRLVALYAGDANDHQRKMFADSLRAALTVEEVRAIIVPFGFAPDAVAMTSDRHWTWSGLKA